MSAIDDATLRELLAATYADDDGASFSVLVAMSNLIGVYVSALQTRAPRCDTTAIAALRGAADRALRAANRAYLAQDAAAHTNGGADLRAPRFDTCKAALRAVADLELATRAP
jgi:hypothetical protein